MIKSVFNERPTTPYQKAKEIVLDHLIRAKEGYWTDKHSPDAQGMTIKEIEAVLPLVDKVADRMIRKLNCKD